MRHRNSEPWITASCAFLVLALVLAGEGFLVIESITFHPSGTHFLASRITLKALLGDVSH
jgi:hypothetical protein